MPYRNMGTCSGSSDMQPWRSRQMQATHTPTRLLSAWHRRASSSTASHAPARGASWERDTPRVLTGVISAMGTFTAMRNAAQIKDRQLTPLSCWTPPNILITPSISCSSLLAQYCILQETERKRGGERERKREKESVRALPRSRSAR